MRAHTLKLHRQNWLIAALALLLLGFAFAPTTMAKGLSDNPNVVQQVDSLLWQPEPEDLIVKPKPSKPKPKKPGKAAKN